MLNTFNSVPTMNLFLFFYFHRNLMVSKLFAGEVVHCSRFLFFLMELNFSHRAFEHIVFVASCINFLDIIYLFLGSWSPYSTYWGPGDVLDWWSFKGKNFLKAFHWGLWKNLYDIKLDKWYPCSQMGSSLFADTQ